MSLQIGLLWGPAGEGGRMTEVLLWPLPGRARLRGLQVRVLQGYLAHKKRPPPWDLHRALGIGLP